MKKIISILLCAVLLCSLSFSTVYATEVESENEEAFVEFIHEEGISEELKAKIENHLLGKPSVESRGILCTIFGHDLVSTITTQITHKASATAPRCLEETYEVKTCEDCDYVNSTLISRGYIYCCS